AGLEVWFAKQVYGFIHTVREQEFGRTDAEVRRNERLHGFTLRITCEFLGGDRMQTGKDTRRAAHGVLVEIQAHALATGKWRMVRREVPNCSSGFKHFCTSLGWSRRVLVDLPPPPGS